MKSKPTLLAALADVRELRKRVLDRQLFNGYSGHARIAGGCLALLGAIVLSQELIPPTPQAHIIGWGMVCAAAFTVNFAAVAYRWKDTDSDMTMLRPIFDLVAPFVVGALLTFALISHSQHDLLFPSWMWLFGLMNIASRHSMPKSTAYLGWYYIAAGALCILSLPYTSFTNPWPMGITFCCGEVIGGLTFIKLHQENDA